MKMTLSFAEHDLRNGVASDKIDAVERIGLDVIKNGGTVEPTFCHDGNARNRLTAAPAFRDWMKDFRTRNGIMTLSKAVNGDLSGPGGKVTPIENEPR